jgi:uncharacterized protein (DUF1501 family)
MNRRMFIKSTGLALFGGAVLAHAGTGGGKKVLVAIFQRGAVDGLNVVVPYGEEAYYGARPSIAIPRADVLDLDGFFGLHPAMAPLLPYFKDHSLAFVQAAGSPDATRSHFDAQDFMETGTPGVKSTRDGFLARAMGVEAPTPSPLRAVALTASLPRILAGCDAVALTSIANFGVREKAFEAMYGGEMFEAATILKSVEASKAQYPQGPLANSLKQIAQLIKANVGLEVAFADVGGWDTHAGQGGSQGQLANNLRSLAEAIAAFARDLGSRMADVVLVTMSEFGRTVRENGTRGTDHGHANAMLLLGGGVKGGRVHGRWPGLAREALFEGRDLAVTTDFRDVFSELITRQLSVTDIGKVFPRYQAKSIGLLA